MTSITKQLEALKIRVSAAAAEADRDPRYVQILAASKKQPPDAVREVAAAGIIGFGENYLQEALEKIPKCGEELKWHFIGTIQSNKTRAIAAAFDWVQTVT